MEQAEHIDAPDGAARSQHLVYTLPQSAESLASVLAPTLERIDTGSATTQVVIITLDAESAVMASDVVYQLAGANGVEAVPVTSANRAARLIESRPMHVVAGPPLELQTLVQRSTLKLGDVKTVVLAWADKILASGLDAVSSLEALFVEFPKDAGRLIITHQITSDVEQLIERYARTARRIDAGADAHRDAAVDTSHLTMQYVTISDSARLSVLRRLLDDFDPPSAAVVVRPGESEGEVHGLLQQLGYRQGDAPVRVSTGDVTADTHTVIFFDPPATRAAAVAAASGVVQLVALVTPGELETLRLLGASMVPFTLSNAGSTARQHDRMLRDDLLGVLGGGITLREIIALEPLLEQYDGIEIAAAAVRLLEQARAQRHQTHAAAGAAAPPREERFKEARQERSFSDRPKRDFEDRPKRDFGDRPKRDFNDRPKRDFGDRPKRDFSDRPKRDFGDRPKRDFSDRPKRDFSDRPKRDFNDRPKRDFGERPKRDFNDRAPRFGEDRPRRDFNDRPKRDFSSQRDERGGGGPPRQDRDGRKRNFGRDK